MRCNKIAEHLFFWFMDFSLLSVSEFFVFRKMKTYEIINHLLCGWSRGVIQKITFPSIIEVSKPLSIERKGDFMAKKSNSLAHTKWMCKYHIVFTPKYRRKMIYNQYKRRFARYSKTALQLKGSWNIGGGVFLQNSGIKKDVLKAVDKKRLS